ncbi:zinc finger protein 136-like [Melanaphis sacchari]|uniref:zinc finger protein 136-like n=1 Tax=Melanaphis sacchari TaxID=742174 RepID=UPI000DC152F5|nr:zinc finger protein 136-like [Melanaphis sacchari]
MSQMHLHSENFDLCRICLAEPEADRSIEFVHIFTTVNEDFKLKPQLEELLGIKVGSNDVKPKMICNNCYKSLFAWYEMKKKASESDIVINYIASKKFGVNNPGTSKASNSSQKSRDIKQPNKIENNFNPGTSKASNSSQKSRGIKQPNKIENNFNPGTSKASNSSQKSRDIKQPNKIKNNFNECSTSSSTGYCKREDSSRSPVASCSKSVYVDDSDDCIEVKPSIDIIEILSDDDENNGIKEECIYVSDDEIVDNNIKHEYHVISSDDESVDNNINHYNRNYQESAGTSYGGSEARNQVETTENINNKNEKLYYCSICQKKNILNHDCSQYNINFSTCLVPNCNILSRSKDDFLPHYQLHIGMSPSANMCIHCYHEINEPSSSSATSFYHRCAVNAFKCYTCNVKFTNMKEFAYHKLKKHNGRLMDSSNNYLCLYCEESSPELTDIIDHTKQCLENQANNVTTVSLRLRIPTENTTELLPVAEETLNTNVLVERNQRTKKNSVRTSKMILFTCLKPSCNLVFQSFSVFKEHYREHFGIGDRLVCWQCCKPFDDLNGLRLHQVRFVCATPGMFKCPMCQLRFDNMQCISIHKYTFHNGHLIAGKKNNNTIKCAFCKSDVRIYNFKSHLMTCRKKKSQKCTKPAENANDYSCKTCGKVFQSLVSLSNHLRSHKSS